MESTDFYGDVTRVSYYVFNTTVNNGDHNRTTGEDVFDVYKLINVVSNLGLSAVICGVNSLTLLTECRTKSLKNIRNKYIVSLALADLQVGFTYGGMVFQNFWNEHQGMDECCYFLGTLYSSLTVSLFSMLLVALDRYIYIAHPFCYMRKVTERKLNIAIFVKWATSYSYGFSTTLAARMDSCDPSYIFDNIMIEYAFPSFFLIICIGIGITYGRTAMIAKIYVDRRSKRVALINEVLVKNSHSLKDCRKKDGVRSASRDHLVESSLAGLAKEEVSSVKTDEVIVKDKHNNIDIKLFFSEDEIILELEQQQYTTVCQNVQKRSDVDEISNIKKELTSEDRFTEELDEFDETNIKKIGDADQKSVPMGTKLSIPPEIFDKAIDKISNIVTDRQKQKSSVDPKNEPPDKTPVAERVPNPCSLASLRWLKQMVVVFGLFVVFWTPSMVYILLSLVYKPEIRLMYILSAFGVANSAVNFFVYSFLNKDFRTAMKTRLRCHCKEEVMT